MKSIWNKLSRKQKNDIIIIIVLMIVYLVYRFVR